MTAKKRIPPAPVSAPGEDAIILQPIYRTKRGFWILCAVLWVFILWAAYLYVTQLRTGLSVTGLNRPVFWGFYIINFVFFIGISHAGTLISAILRLCQAEWRRPITRMAEVITVAVLLIGGVHPVLDLGRPDRMLNLINFGRLQSPLLWDVISVAAYFTASSTYLFLPMIPDIAILRDEGRKMRWFYEILSWGWQGTQKQKKVLDRAIKILMVMVIPIAISVHTIIAYIFAMTVNVGWHSTIFGPYFVVGAIYSGIAALFIMMFILRKLFSLEKYLKLVHFRNLSKLLLVMALIWFYFTFSEMLTGYFGGEPHELEILWAKFTGKYALAFWLMALCNLVLPIVILSNKRLNTFTGIFVASVGVVIGMWLERYLIVVPTLSNTHLAHGIYHPTVTEISLFLGAISVFILIFLTFSKFFPVISIWEIEEGREEAVHEVSERVEGYQPDPAAATATNKGE